jgi:hypothetical protein
MKIKNIKLVHREPGSKAFIRNGLNTELLVTLKRNYTIPLEIVREEDGTELFYSPSWKIHGKNLKKVINECLEMEYQYEKRMQEEANIYGYHPGDELPF